MGKIKSARELAMERTAGLKNTMDESAGLEYEPYLKAASLLASAYLKEESTLEKVVDTIGRYPAGAREEAARTFLKKVITEMNLENSSKVIAAYRQYRPDAKGDPVKSIEELEELERSYRNKVRELHAAVETGKYREQLLEPLLRDGISGTAITGVNLARSAWWAKELSRLAAPFEPQLTRLKEQLPATLDRQG